MASMIALPRKGHLRAVFQILSFLKSEYNDIAVFDSTDPEIDQTQFPTKDLSTTPYGPCKGDAPSNAPSPRGIGFTMRAFFTLIMIVNRFHIAQELALLNSSIVLLCLCVLRNRGAVRHLVLVLSS